MATKIRLQRGGRKGHAIYSIVTADVRAPRDGKCIEKIGTYNPNTTPATINLNFDRALYWLETGAQPTDTARYILKSEACLHDETSPWWCKEAALLTKLLASRSSTLGNKLR